MKAVLMARSSDYPTSSSRSFTPDTSISHAVDHESGSLYSMVDRQSIESASLLPDVVRPARHIRHRSFRSTKLLRSEDDGKGFPWTTSVANPPLPTSFVSVPTNSEHTNEWDLHTHLSGNTPLSDSDYTVRQTSDPPRLPRDGFEWVWFPEGYWAEREYRRMTSVKPRWWNRPSIERGKSRDFIQSRTNSATPLPVAQNDLSLIKVGSTEKLLRSREGSAALERPCVNRNKSSTSQGGPQLMESPTSSGTGELGLCCRTKKSILSRFGPKDYSPLKRNSVISVEGKSHLESRTTLLLRGTSSFFEKQWDQKLETVKKNPTVDMLKTSHTFVSTESASMRFGVAPWHRKNSQDSLLSVTSSVIDFLKGKTPPGTPYPEPRYIGYGGKDYPIVEISSRDPHGPSFLPSEARRINTPPMSAGSPTMQPRGMFFDFNAQNTLPSSAAHSAPTSVGSGSEKAAQKTGSTSSLHWWEADIKHSTTNKSSHNSPSRGFPSHNAIQMMGSIKPFELDLPEHLPNSPLCPLNFTHKTRGKGICAYHGRRKNVRVKNSQIINTGSTSG